MVFKPADGRYLCETLSLGDLVAMFLIISAINIFTLIAQFFAVHF